MPVWSRISPTSGASRDSMGKGCGQMVGCDTQCWGMVMAAKPQSRATWQISTASSICSCSGRAGLVKKERK